MTFYSVKYARLGADRLETAFFDSRDAAYDFYNAGDHRDKPEAHSVSDPNKINEYKDLVARSAWEIAQ